MLFVSHANPEDNEAARWLALQLAREGYPVWCDLTKLLGGEDFWRDAEQAIRERTAKFLYVLTRVSNDKQGALDELQVAKNVAREHKFHDFIIPLRYDDLPPRQANIRLANLNSVPFHGGWAAGLAQLLQKLAEEGVAKDPRFSPTSVAKWWRRFYRREQLLRREPERLVSNWFPVLDPPPLQLHELRSRDAVSELELSRTLPYPAIQHEECLVSFADAHDFAEALPAGLSVVRSRRLMLTRDAEDERREWWTFDQEHNALIALLRQAWVKHLRDRAMPTYVFASGGESMYFTSGLASEDRVYLPSKNGGRQPYRQVLGFATTRKATAEAPARLRYWHFGVEARPTLDPQLAYAMRPHVLFSDDGQTIWDNKDLLHRARRNQCKQWWNDVWRDRLLGTVLWLADGKEHLALSAGSSQTLLLATRPLEYTSPLTYDDSGFEGPPLDEGDDEDIEEEASAPASGSV
ncbi:MAG: toll/interleukin-1 receptor domain-containing protein [Candidatus Kerfeldbacteria bacterium]